MKIGWLYTSEEEKRNIKKTLQILNSDEGAVDELGFGRVRNWFSNYLFPGTSVLQTRAKYFLIVPYIFKRVENDAISTNNTKETIEERVENKVKYYENEMIVNLYNNTKGEKNGIIGIDSKKSNAISYYWNGLRVLGILCEQDETFSRAITKLINNIKIEKDKKLSSRNKEGNEDDGLTDNSYNKKNKIFDIISFGETKLEDTSLELTSEESDYLFKKITETEGMKNSLFAEMLKNREAYFDEKGNAKKEKFEDIEYDGKNEDLKDKLELAKEFSNFAYGARLFYNIIRVKKNNRDEEEYKIKKEKLEGEFFTIWLENLKKPKIDRIVGTTVKDIRLERFLNDWWKCCENLKKAKDDKDIIRKAEELITKRERDIKKNRAKLCKIEDEDFDIKSINVSSLKLDFRYHVVKNHCKDIINGLNKKQ